MRIWLDFKKKAKRWSGGQNNIGHTIFPYKDIKVPVRKDLLISPAKYSQLRSKVYGIIFKDEAI